MSAIVPGRKGLVDLVCLVNGIDGLLDVPETRRTFVSRRICEQGFVSYLLVNGNVVANAAELPLYTDAGWIIWAGLDGVEWRAALRVCVVVIVLRVL